MKDNQVLIVVLIFVVFMVFFSMCMCRRSKHVSLQQQELFKEKTPLIRVDRNARLLCGEKLVEDLGKTDMSKDKRPCVNCNWVGDDHLIQCECQNKKGVFVKKEPVNPAQCAIPCDIYNDEDGRLKCVTRNWKNQGVTQFAETDYTTEKVGKVSKEVDRVYRDEELAKGTTPKQYCDDKLFVKDNKGRIIRPVDRTCRNCYWVNDYMFSCECRRSKSAQRDPRKWVREQPINPMQCPNGCRINNTNGQMNCKAYWNWSRRDFT